MQVEGNTCGDDSRVARVEHDHAHLTRQQIPHDGSASSSENTTVHADAGRFAGRRMTSLRFHSTALPNRGTRAPASSGCDEMTGSRALKTSLARSFNCTRLNCQTPRSRPAADADRPDPPRCACGPTLSPRRCARLGQLAGWHGFVPEICAKCCGDSRRRSRSRWSANNNN